MAKDLDFRSLYLQYSELTKMPRVKDLSIDKLIKFLCHPERFELFKEVTIVLSRILACSPQVADVERCISVNNKIKTNIRASLSVATENKYLTIYFNLPVLNHWTTQKAVEVWFSQKERRQHPNAISGNEKTIRQKYWKGIFESSNEINSDEEDADEKTEVVAKFSF